MPDSRPMPEVAAGVSELRLGTSDRSFRAFYYTVSPQGILVFHVFAKPDEIADVLGLPRAEAEEWQFQHALLARLKEIVGREKLTHLEVAKRSGTSRTRITSILNNALKHVSSDLMIRVLASRGYRVKVSVVRSKNAA